MTRAIKSTIITCWLGSYNINYYNSLTRVIRSTIITHWLGSYNINYYNPLIRVEYVNNYNPLTRGHIIQSQTLYLINLNLQNKISYLLNFSFFINKENFQIYFPYKTHIWSMRKDKNNIFTHFKIQYQNEIILFYKNLH